MLQPLRILLVLVGCLHLCGGHYGVLQVLAWSQMIVDYSAERGIIEGTIRTFNGKHPCEFCKSIAEARAEQQSDPFQRPAERDRFAGIELKELLPGDPTALKALADQPYVSPTSSFEHLSNSLLHFPPEVPPPRAS